MVPLIAHNISDINDSTKCATKKFTVQRFAAIIPIKAFKANAADVQMAE